MVGPCRPMPPAWPTQLRRETNLPGSPRILPRRQVIARLGANGAGARWRLAASLWFTCAAWLALAPQARGEIEFGADRSARQQPLAVRATSARRWRQDSYEVWLLRGECVVTQGARRASADHAVLWVRKGNPLENSTTRVVAYLEGNVELDGRNAGDGEIEPWVRPAGEGRQAPLAFRERSPESDSQPPAGASWLGEFEAERPPDFDVGPIGPEPNVKPAILSRARQARFPAAEEPDERDEDREPSLDGRSRARLAQFTDDNLDEPARPPARTEPGFRRFRIFRRSSTGIQAEILPDSTRENGYIVVATSGMNIVIEGLRAPEGPGGMGDLGPLDVTADRVVVWTQAEGDIDPGGDTLQSQDTPLEIYLEGNAVFRQGDRVVYADRMYYDVRRRAGTLLGAEILTPAPGYQGLIRVKAAAVRQLGEGRFLAQDSYVTTSRLDDPRYRLESREILFQDDRRMSVDPVTGQPEIDDLGRPVYDRASMLTSRNNVLYLGPAPVFYWPSFTTDLRQPTFFVRNAQVQNDRIFGTWASTELDAFQLFGARNRPAGVDATLNLDYLTERGFGGGATVRYQRPDLFGYGGRAAGAIDGWIVGDSGHDNLGRTRQNLVPEKDLRYRLFGQHRQDVFGDYRLTAEVGLLSDRNFLEQYYEWEWDQLKDQNTGVELKRTIDNLSWSVSSDVRVNDFFTQTEWLPRGDHFWLGQSLWEDRLTWSEHTSGGFARLKTASTPLDPQDAANFKLLPWESNVSGGRFATRHEVDAPFMAGPFKIVPYVLGEFAYWGQDLSQHDVVRLYGQTGVRASIPFWAVNPFVESDLFNLHGLAHKVMLDAEFSYSDANRNLAELPLYDPLDDDAQEHFRRRLAFQTFGGSTPLRFDERFYALRSGLQNWVTSPSVEVADDLMAMRVGLRQRWQTKRGPVQNRRIIDWIVFDVQAALFPKPGRDNFGENIGLAGYDFRWHVGDRFTVLSDGTFDFFHDGQETYSVGALLTRPGTGNWYWGYRSIGGPVHSKVVSSSYAYRVSPKWIVNLGASYDLGGSGNIGQSFGFTRIGESFLTGLAFNVDSGKNNVGLTFLIEPRFAPRSRLGRVGGTSVPMAGFYGLE